MSQPLTPPGPLSVLQPQRGTVIATSPHCHQVPTSPTLPGNLLTGAQARGSARVTDGPSRYRISLRFVENPAPDPLGANHFVSVL